MVHTYVGKKQMKLRVIDWIKGKLRDRLNDSEHTVRQRDFHGFGFVSSFFNIFKALDVCCEEFLLTPCQHAAFVVVKSGC